MASTLEERHSLLSDSVGTSAYGSAVPAEDEECHTRQHKHSNLMKRLAHGDRKPSILPTSADIIVAGADGSQQQGGKKGPIRFLYYVVYALVNVIISAPGLYGYAAVIFNHPVYESHMNALSKLVIFSSLIHQLGFTLFSTLDFSIGTVQDAGLVFLSAMANKIANSMLEDGHTTEEIVTTTLVLLSSGTALLGICLIVVGRFGLADAVSYLPMPGNFCAA